MYFRPLRGEILAKADVKGKVEVAGPEVDAVIPSQRHLVHIFVKNLKTTVLDEPLEQKILKIEELIHVAFIGDNFFFTVNSSLKCVDLFDATQSRVRLEVRHDKF